MIELIETFVVRIDDTVTINLKNCVPCNKAASTGARDSLVAAAICCDEAKNVQRANEVSRNLSTFSRKYFVHAVEINPELNDDVVKASVTGENARLVKRRRQQRACTAASMFWIPFAC